MAEAVAAIATATMAITLASMFLYFWDTQLKYMIQFAVGGAVSTLLIRILLPLSPVLALGIGVGSGLFAYTMAQEIWGTKPNAVLVQGTLKAVSVLWAGGFIGGVADSMELGVPVTALAIAVGAFLGTGPLWNAVCNLAADMNITKPLCTSTINYPGQNPLKPCVRPCTYDWGGKNEAADLQTCVKKYNGTRNMWCAQAARFANRCPDAAKGYNPGEFPAGEVMNYVPNDPQCSIYKPYLYFRKAVASFEDLCAPCADEQITKAGFDNRYKFDPNSSWNYLKNNGDGTYGCRYGLSGPTGSGDFWAKPCSVKVGANLGTAMLGWKFNPSDQGCRPAYQNSKQQIVQLDIAPQPTKTAHNTFCGALKNFEAKLEGDYNVAHVRYNKAGGAYSCATRIGEPFEAPGYSLPK